MEAALEPVGLKEAKEQFSALTARVNALGAPVTIMKHNRPWVVIQPADAVSALRAKKLAAFRELTKQIEASIAEEPTWDSTLSDWELLAQEREARFG